MQIILNAQNLAAIKDLDTVLKETIIKINVINSLQKEYDSVAVFVGETLTAILSVIQPTLPYLIQKHFKKYVKQLVGTNGSEILGTLEEFFEQTDQSLSDLRSWPDASSDVAFQTKAEFQATLIRHRHDIKLAHDAVISQIEFYTWAQKLFLDWLFMVR